MQLKEIFENFPYGILVVSAEKPFTIVDANTQACTILALPQKGIIQKQIREVFDDDFAPLVQLINETCQQKRPIKNLTIELRIQEQTKNFLVNTTFLGDSVKRSQILLVLHDISETGHRSGKESPDAHFETLIGTSSSMKNIYSTIETVAPTDASVLIYGATGTGKELVARAIHRCSHRANRPFIPVHCSAITSSLLESYLFGHVKGAFTGAIKDKPGRFELADGGTIFLDEIATLTPDIQVSLLRVLQEKTIERVGGTKSIDVDVRILSATNKKLPALIKQELFRKDLYYRIKVLQINLPSLRNRKKDIPLLAEHFIAKFNRQHGCKILGISSDVMKILRQHPWPGNVRELENAIEHASIIAQYGMIEPWHLPEEIQHYDNEFPGSSDKSGVQSEKDKIRGALKQSGGNVSRAAAILGIHRTTLWRKMQAMNISKLSHSSV